jgi:hypothetical protein
MGVIAPLNEAIVAVDWQCNGRTDVATITWGARPFPDSMTPDNIASNVDEALTAAGLTVAANFSGQWTYLGVRTYKRVTGGSIPGVFPVSRVGSTGTNTVPSNCAILVQKHTNFGGRANRGRVYWPPIYWSETNIGSGGVATGSDVTALQNRMVTLLTALSTENVPMVLMHSDGSPSVDVTSLTVQSLIATQRGRLR